MTRQPVTVEGLKELESALSELPHATAKNVMRRTLRKAIEPTLDDTRARVPVDRGELRDSIGLSTRLSRRQRARHRRLVAEGKASVEMFAGVAALPHAHLVEFGTSKVAPRPYLRPAWDTNKHAALEIVKTETWNEIEKAAARLAKKKMKKAA